MDCSPGVLVGIGPVCGGAQLSSSQDLREAAANLFRYLRELDQLNLDLIVAEKFRTKDSVAPSWIGCAGRRTDFNARRSED